MKHEKESLAQSVGKSATGPLTGRSFREMAPTRGVTAGSWWWAVTAGASALFLGLGGLVAL